MWHRIAPVADCDWLKGGVGGQCNYAAIAEKIIITTRNKEMTVIYHLK